MSSNYLHMNIKCLLTAIHMNITIVYWLEDTGMIEHGALTVSITAYGFQQLKLYIKFCKRSKNTHRFIKGITIFLQFIWKVGQVCFFNCKLCSLFDVMKCYSSFFNVCIYMQVHCKHCNKIFFAPAAFPKPHSTSVHCDE